MGTVVTVQDKLENLVFPTGLRWTRWLRYNPLNVGELWEPLARGNDGGATVLNADGTFIREYTAELDNGDVTVKLVLETTTAANARTTTWWIMTAGVQVDCTATMTVPNWLLAGTLMRGGVQTVLDGFSDSWLTR